MDCYRLTANRLRQSGHAVALTGAGISVESGIPDFRSEKGLWTRYDPMEFGTIQSFRAHPEKVWKMLLEMDGLLSNAQPNAAHLALADLERRGILKAVVTQNVDSLHQKAGSCRVIEFHGHNRTLSCIRCGKQFCRANVSLTRLPPPCSCGGALRPDLVFFGENIPPEAHQQAIWEAEHCDVMLIVGTSATVAPASYLPYTAKERGAFILEINPARTELSYRTTDLHIQESAGQALPAILSALDEMSSFGGMK
jgi:NAD-dependent deacetylase